MTIADAVVSSVRGWADRAKIWARFVNTTSKRMQQKFLTGSQIRTALRAEIIVGALVGTLLFSVTYLGFDIGAKLEGLVTQAKRTSAERQLTTPVSGLPLVVPTATAASSPALQPTATVTPKPVSTPTPQPTSTATPKPGFYRAAPFGPVTVEANSNYIVKLGPMSRGTRLKAIVTVKSSSTKNRSKSDSSINTAIGILTGVRDQVKVLNNWSSVEDGAELDWQAPSDGEFAIILTNESESVAKQVKLEFLQGQ